MKRFYISLLLLLILNNFYINCFRINVDYNNNNNNNRIGHDNIPTNGLTCDLCKVGISDVQKLIKSNKTEDDVAEFITDFCIVFKIEKREVCEGIVNLFRNETFSVLNHIGDSPEYVCGFLSICPYTPSNFTGIVQFPKPKPPHVTPVPPPPGSSTKRILHLSDMHIDQLYQPGSNNDCGMPICCRVEDGPGQSPQTTAGKWGDYQCDVNMLMVTSMLEYISEEIGQIDYLFWTGDNPPHDVWMQTRETQLNATSLITDLMKKYFPDTVVLPVIGNHEGLPVNSFPLPGTPGSTWLFDGVAEYWEDWLSPYPSAIDTLKYGGYYIAPVEPGLLVIGLNMNWCNNINMWIIENATDPASQLQWTIDRLQEAEDNGDKVFIVGHIPPGLSDCIDLWSQQYYQIINRYEDTIISQFYGHTHRDHFQVFYTQDNTNRPTSIAYITPSSTTYQNQNPSFRIYSMDSETFYLTEISTYHTDLTLANLQDQATWQLEYNSTTAYTMSSLFPTDWDDVINNLSVNETMYNSFYNNYFSNSPYPQSNPCDDTCQSQYVCHLKSGTSYLYDTCINQQLSNILHEKDEESYEKYLSLLKTISKSNNNKVC